MRTQWLDEAFRGPAWHGPSLLQSIKGVTEREALRRPGRGRHNIAELVVHAAYWKYAVRRRLTKTREPFALPGKNFFARTAPGRWRQDVKLLKDEHARLCAAVAKLPETARRKRVHGRQTAWFNIRGVGAHDV